MLREVRALGCVMLALAAWTAQAGAQEPLSRIAFGSCANQNKPQPIWGPIVATEPQLFQ